MPRIKIWYVEANNGHSEEAIGAELNEMHRTECFHRGVLCQDGRKRDFWEVEYSFITMLLKYETNAHLKFSVFCRDGRYGPVKPWRYLRKKQQARDKARSKGAVKKGAPTPQAA